VTRSLLLVAFALPLVAAAQPPAEVKKLLDLTNAEREKNKLPPLKLAGQLVEAAQTHTAAMAKAGKLDHDLDGVTLPDRLKKVGYLYSKAAENIAQGPDVPPEVLFKGWIESPLHKANLLSDEYTEIGIGWDKTAKGDCYATQVFGKPRK